MTPEDFAYIQDMLKTRSGLVLTPEKMYLVESRLTPVARKNKLSSVDELVGIIRNNPSKDLLVAVTEAMTTNESFFFRDQKPFDQFRDMVLPYLLTARSSKKAFRIWSAAASTGQEPYSLAMLINEMAAKVTGWKIDIIGTDISNEVLKRARAGTYTQFEVQRGLPITLLMKYFDQVNESWNITDNIKQMVEYKYFNLLDNLAPLGQFDVVYCRNVFIYFDLKTKQDILERLSKIMAPDGFLFLGGAETVLGITDKFKPIEGFRGVYGQTGQAGMQSSTKAVS